MIYTDEICSQSIDAHILKYTDETVTVGHYSLKVMQTLNRNNVERAMRRGIAVTCIYTAFLVAILQSRQ